MALSAGTYRGRLGDRLYTTEMPRAGEVVSLNGLGSAGATPKCLNYVINKARAAGMTPFRTGEQAYASFLCERLRDGRLSNADFQRGITLWTMAGRARRGLSTPRVQAKDGQSGFFLRGLGSGTQYPYQTLTLGQTPGEQPVGGSCGSLGPGYSDKCAGKSYVECLDSAGANTGYRTRCAEAFGVPSWTASMRPASPGIRMAMHVASIAGLTLGAYHGSKRNNGKVWPAIGWGLIGGMFWPVVIPVILAQGVGKR